MLRLNSTKLRFLGSVEVPEAPEKGRDYHFAIIATITGNASDDNFDGTEDVTYKARLNRVEFLKPDGTIVKSKDNKKKSQRLHGAIWGWGQEHGDEDENLYDWFMGWVIVNIDRLIPLAKAEREKEL